MLKMIHHKLPLKVHIMSNLHQPYGSLIVFRPYALHRLVNKPWTVIVKLFDGRVLDEKVGCLLEFVKVENCIEGRGLFAELWTNKPSGVSWWLLWRILGWYLALGLG